MQLSHKMTYERQETLPFHISLESIMYYEGDLVMYNNNVAIILEDISGVSAVDGREIKMYTILVNGQIKSAIQKRLKNYKLCAKCT